MLGEDEIAAVRQQRRPGKRDDKREGDDGEVKSERQRAEETPSDGLRQRREMVAHAFCRKAAATWVQEPVVADIAPRSYEAALLQTLQQVVNVRFDSVGARELGLCLTYCLAAGQVIEDLERGGR